MPYKVPRPCKYPGCVHTTLTLTRYCETHAHHYQPPQRPADTRPSAAARGYDSEWQRIRAGVLRGAGIPRQLWHLYDVHHEPEYNPDIDPNHRNYTLTPMLHGEHSRQTGRQRGEGVKSLGVSSPDRYSPKRFSSSKMGKRAKNGGENGR